MNKIELGEGESAGPKFVCVHPPLPPPPPTHTHTKPHQQTIFSHQFVHYVSMTPGHLTQD